MNPKAKVCFIVLVVVSVLVVFSLTENEKCVKIQGKSCKIENLKSDRMCLECDLGLF